MHVAGALAALAAAALAAAGSERWPWPLVLWLVLVMAVGPYLPSWQLYLPIILHGPRARPEVALTFDDGPDPRSLPRLLALLAEDGTPATFFVVGRRAAAHPDAVRAILAAGHELGNHSDTHDVFLATRPPSRALAEIQGCQAALAAHGVRPLLFRPPVGITSPPLRGVLRTAGLRCIAWSRRGRDFGNRRWRGLARRVLRGVRPGDIVLLHDALPPPTPLDAWLQEIRAVLDGLRQRGLRPVALSALLGAPVMERGEATAAAPAAWLDGSSGAGSDAGAGSAGGTLARLSQGLLFLFTLAYPLLVAVSLAWLGARWAALTLLGLHLVLRLRTLRHDLARARGLLATGASVAVLLAAGAVLDDPRFLLAYPSLVSLALLVQFAWSLRGVSMAERFARLELKEGEALPPEGVRYCRRVTLVWCAFFLLNGGAATALAALAPRTVWAIYTGGVSYALIGLLFAAEYVIRRVRFGRYGAGPVDRVLARWFSRAEGAP
jgi:uncharacterized membrane protein/peptidoglycan/xylan/chitin deacetylase (PgdA/CDA1 family)